MRSWSIQVENLAFSMTILLIWLRAHARLELSLAEARASARAGFFAISDTTCVRDVCPQLERNIISATPMPASMIAPTTTITMPSSVVEMPRSRPLWCEGVGLQRMR